MSTYSGNFVVNNNTGATITDCIVCHVCSGQKTTLTGTMTLNQGQSSDKFPIWTQSSSKDRWSVSFVGNGQLFTGYETCGFESEDNNGTVTINLGAEDFSIVMPSSSSCDGNDYDQT
jgi:hypothetical protein